MPGEVDGRGRAEFTILPGMSRSERPVIIDWRTSTPSRSCCRTPCLKDIRCSTNWGRMFESVGLHTPAVDAYSHANEPKQAVDCCVLLNQWRRGRNSRGPRVPADRGVAGQAIGPTVTGGPEIARCRVVSEGPTGLRTPPSY